MGGIEATKILKTEYPDLPVVVQTACAFPEEKEISFKLVDRLIADERSKLREKSSDMTLVEEKVFDVRLNGYSVSKWDGAVAQTVEVSLAASFASTQFMKELEKTCTHFVGRNQISFHSSLLLHHIDIRDSLPDRPTYILIHPHGELTDVAGVDRGACVFFGSYPVGINTVKQRIMSQTNLDSAAVESAIDLHSRAELDPSHGRELSSSLDQTGRGWVNAFRALGLETTMGNTDSVRHIIVTRKPYDVFLTKNLLKMIPRASIESRAISTTELHYPSLIRVISEN